MSLLHRLKHLFGWHMGRVVTLRIDVQEQSWIGFQCRECGDISALTEPFGRDWPLSKRPDK